MIAGTGFRLVQIEDVWPRYAQRAARCGADSSVLAWVVADCQAGAAVCLECDDGIAVLTLRVRGAMVVAKVLLAVSRGTSGAVERREREVVAVARDMGAAEVSFRTDRERAWCRVLGPQWSNEGDRFWRST